MINKSDVDIHSQMLTLDVFTYIIATLTISLGKNA